MDLGNHSRIQPIVDSFKRHWAQKLYEIALDQPHTAIQAEVNTISTSFNQAITDTSAKFGFYDQESLKYSPQDWERMVTKIEEWSQQPTESFTFPDSQKLFQIEFQRQLNRRLTINRLPIITAAMFHNLSLIHI